MGSSPSAGGEAVTVEIPLTRGLVALIDDQDYDLVSPYKWRAHTSRSKIYAATGQHQDLVLMHRLILGVPDDMLVDHRDRDGLHNWRDNLRPATESQNAVNRAYAGRSGYRGVWVLRYGFGARIKTNQRRENIGDFRTAEEAARAYDRRAVELFGDFAQLSFPD